MIKVYGMKTCPYCAYIYEQIKGESLHADCREDTLQIVCPTTIFTRELCKQKPVSITVQAPQKKLMRMLTDRWTEYCGNTETHEYELYLAVEHMDQSEIKAKSPQTNAICDRFNRTVQNEFNAIAFRKKIYTTIAQLQTDLDTWMNSYNTEITRSGKFCFGETPMRTFIEGITVARKYQLQNQERIKPNEVDKTPSGNESEESYVTSQQTSDTFLSDSKRTVRASLDYYN